MLISSVSCVVSGFILHPIDTVRIRMQLVKTKQTIRYNSLIGGFMLIAWEEGLGSKGLYKGIKGSFLLESGYGGLRLGLYEPVKNIICQRNDSKNTPIWVRFTAGGITGVLASFLGIPCDIVKVRM